MSPKSKTLLLMIIAMVLGYLPWYNFSAVLTFIAEDFNLSTVETGAILSTFQVGYVIVVVFTGWLADKIGPKKVIAWATLLTAIFSTMFIWFANGFISILILRLLTGCAAGAIYAPGMALLSNWFEPSERGKALGAYTGALVAAYAGGYFVAAPLAAKYGWETGILWTSLPVFIAAIIVFVFIKDKPINEELQYDGVPGLNTQPPVTINPAPEGGYKGPILITAGYMGHMWELYAFWGWIGPFMVASAISVGYSTAEAVSLGGLLAAFIILAGAPSSWLWGIVADKWGRSKAIIIAALCSLVAQFFFGYLYGQSLFVIFVVGLWIGFWVISDSAIFKAGLTDMVSPRIRGTVLGLQSAIGYSMTILAPLAFGVILEVLNGSSNPTSATNWGIPFMLLGLGALLAPIAIIILRKTPQAKLMANGKM